MNDEQVKQFLESQYYLFVTKIPGRGWCGIEPMVFTWGLTYGMDEHTKEGRYCFPSLRDAIDALHEWPADPLKDPPGPWIKHKGKRGEYPNPEIVKS